MVWLVFLGLVLINECQGSSPPLSDDEISELPPDLQAQFVLPLKSGEQYHQTRVGFKHRWVDHAGRTHTTKPSVPSINVDATTTVSDLALTKACKIVGLMVRHMSADVFNHLTRSNGVGIFAKSEGLGVYPEFPHAKDTPECKGTCNGSCSITCTRDGRKIVSLAGLTSSRAAVLDDNVLCNSHDPYGHKENILVHEFGHLVDKFMPQIYKDRLHYIFDYNKQHGTWQTGYGTTNAAEHWGEATSSFFHTVLRAGPHSPAVGMNYCNFNHLCGSEMENREWLKKHDHMLYALLVRIYTNNHPTIPSGLKVCI